MIADVAFYILVGIITYGALHPLVRYLVNKDEK